MSTPYEPPTVRDISAGDAHTILATEINALRQFTEDLKTAMFSDAVRNSNSEGDSAMAMAVELWKMGYRRR